jgi:hypothetical protein
VKLERRADGSLRVSHGASLIRVLLCAVAALLPLGAALDARSSLWKLAFGGALALGCVALAGAVEAKQFDFDASRRVFRWSRRSFFRRSGGSVPFDEIADVTVRAHVYRPGVQQGTGSSRWYAVVVDTGSGSFELSSLPYGCEWQQLEFANSIRLLLGRALDGPLEHTVEDLVDAGESIAAIKLAHELRGLSLEDARALVAELEEKSPS